jgi:hypothetical protein
MDRNQSVRQALCVQSYVDVSGRMGKIIVYLGTKGFILKCRCAGQPQGNKFIQSVLRGKINILVGNTIGHSKKKVFMYMCPLPNGFRDRAISHYSTLYAVQTSNTTCPHTSCKVH